VQAFGFCSCAGFFLCLGLLSPPHLRATPLPYAAPAPVPAPSLIQITLKKLVMKQVQQEILSKVAEVKLSYHPLIKPSERAKATTSKECYSYSLKAGIRIPFTSGKTLK